ncbi:hypothetical protein QA640_09385 [Bradyrhizobium sp. CB82]|uniref:hypothetical protein n=1 Tax=Bradyrhizobium sp. CB82 TaxID=3039159 RepID=UPI0024B247C4|nr:hypothetical protein [Bradyrhizobium sp. CB82]WFU42646.1 hypothetical protein QA640_09385 [Bradyrhizobium sp. CB82]
MQQVLKPAFRAAGAEVVATGLFAQLDVAVNDAPSALAKNFRCLRVMLKAGKVFEIAIPAHGALHWF